MAIRRALAAVGLQWNQDTPRDGITLPPTLAARFAGGRGIGPSALCAANALRLSTQIPHRAEYAVVDRPPANGDVAFRGSFLATGPRHTRSRPTQYRGP